MGGLAPEGVPGGEQRGRRGADPVRGEELGGQLRVEEREASPLVDRPGLGKPAPGVLAWRVRADYPAEQSLGAVTDPEVRILMGNLVECGTVLTYLPAAVTAAPPTAATTSRARSQR